MTYKVQQIICPGCNGHGKVAEVDHYGYIDLRCDECMGFGLVDASCACCDRIEPIDDDGFCRDCSMVVTVEDTGDGWHRVAA